MACFVLLPLIFPTFWSFRSPLLSCSETSGSCSLDLPRSHTLWLCFSVLNLVAHLVGYMEPSLAALPRERQTAL